MKITFNSYMELVIPTGDTFSNLSVTPTTVGSGRLSNESKNWQFYRFTKLKLRMGTWYTPGNNQIPVGTIGYLPEEVIASSWGNSAVAELPVTLPFPGTLTSSSTGTTSNLTMVTNMTVPKRVLLSTPTKAWVTNASTEDDFIVQGTLMAGTTTAIGTGAIHIPLWWTGLCEFWGDIPNSLQFFIRGDKPSGARPAPKRPDDEKDSLDLDYDHASLLSDSGTAELIKAVVEERKKKQKLLKPAQLEQLSSILRAGERL